MCYLCEKYGEGGLWYLNPKNYGRSMYRLRATGEGLSGADAGIETGVKPGPTELDLIEAIEAGDQAKFVRLGDELNEATRKRGMECQVVPLRDADKVLELCTSIGLIACICRKDWRAIDERSEQEFTCMGMGAGMLKWERWPERYKGGVKFLNIEEAKEWNHRMDKRGFVHLLMAFGSPLIGGFCQCDFPDCHEIRMAVDFGVGMLKGHHVAVPDYKKCNGCGICAQRCQFGAIKIEVTTDKTNIDPFKCYGCGLCETACSRGAISLVEKKKLPALAEVWR